MIQFTHRRSSFWDGYRGMCFAIDAPSSETLSNLLNNHQNSITLNVGKSRCSNKDQYNKKTGRKLAESRLIPLQFKLDSVHFTGDSVNYHLKSDNMAIYFRCKVGKTKSYFINAFDIS